MLWNLNTDYNPDVIDETGKVICSVHGYGTPEGQWNARLICAAPEMYRLLEEIVDYGLLLDEAPKIYARWFLMKIYDILIILLFAGLWGIICGFLELHAVFSFIGGVVVGLGITHVLSKVRRK